MAKRKRKRRSLGVVAHDPDRWRAEEEVIEAVKDTPRFKRAVKDTMRRNEKQKTENKKIILGTVHPKKARRKKN